MHGGGRWVLNRVHRIGGAVCVCVRVCAVPGDSDVTVNSDSHDGNVCVWVCVGVCVWVWVVVCRAG